MVISENSRKMADCSHDNNSRNISLTLTSHYARSWGSWEGVRELVQNWHDGIYESVTQKDVSLVTGCELIFKQDGSNHRFEACLIESESKEESVLGQLVYDEYENRLTLTNSGTELHKKILLLGYSGKSARKEIIGQFGEGLKIGALALVRNGHLVTMETSKDIWRFDLLHSEEFGEKVLTVVVTDRVTEEDEFGDNDERTDNGSRLHLTPTDTRTTITGIELQDWKKFLPRFLFLQPPLDSVKTEIGTLLLDESLAGQLYVKGLWVSDLSHEDLSGGVNFMSLQVDRDRNAIPKPSEIDHMMSGIWIRAVERRPDLLTRYFHLLKSGPYRDVRHAVQYSNMSLAQGIAAQFLSEYGDSAFPVLNSCSSEQLSSVREQLNMTTVLCNQTLLDILIKSGCYRSLENALEDKRAKQRKPVAFFSLTELEVSVLQKTVALVKMADPAFEVALIDVMETDINETCSGDDTRVCVPRWYLHRESVHKKQVLCQFTSESTEAENIPCCCCEVLLCNSILEVKKEEITKKHRSVLVDNKHHKMANPLLYIMHEMVAKVKTKDADIQHRENPDSQAQARNVNTEVFVARETKLMEKIQKLELLLEDEKSSSQQRLQDLNHNLGKAQKELMSREISLINAEEHIRQSYKQDIEAWKKKGVEKVEELQSVLQKKEDAIIKLQETIEFQNTQLSSAKEQIESVSDAAEKKMGCLMEELMYYISQNRNRTKSLSKICAERYENAKTEGYDSSEKWQLLQGLCDTILQELQQEKVLCSICRMKKKDCLIQPCGHYCVCDQCARTLMSHNRRCPLCRTLMDSYIRVYES